MRAGTAEHPEVVRLVVSFLRDYARMSQTELGRAANVRQAYLSEIESGQKTPSDSVLRRLAAAADVPWPLVTHLRRFYASFVEAKLARKALGADLDLCAADRLAVHSYLLEDAEADGTESEEAHVASFWGAVVSLPRQRRRRAVQFSPRASRSRLLANHLCLESEKAAAADPFEALDLADLAQMIGERLNQEDSSLNTRLLGYTWAYKANALRVATRLAEADQAFARAWTLWGPRSNASTNDPPVWRMLSLEASLRRDQRRFSHSLELLDQATHLVAGEVGALAILALKREFVFEQMGDPDSSLKALEAAAPLVGATGDERLLFALRFKITNNLCQKDRHREAAASLPQVRALAEQLGNDLDLVRVDWLQSRVAAGLGRCEEATALLEKVRREFSIRGNSYNAALASLDLAVLYLKEGRLSEVKTLACEMTEIFTAQRIDREALAALSLLREAAQRETATVDLVKRVIEQIKRAGREIPGNESLSSR